MRQQILNQVINALGQRNSFFLREQDIQLYLAAHFIDSKLFDNVFVEYHVPSNLILDYPWADINNLYIDIVLEKEGQFYPIEIKYKTVAQNLPFCVFGEDVNVVLGHHGAQNIGCYDFWKDIKRIELFEEAFQNVNRGLMLFVSNDATYQNAPLRPGVGYEQFSIHQGRQIPSNTHLNWNGEKAVANGRPGLTTKYNYDINWRPMPLHQHFYILT